MKNVKLRAWVPAEEPESAAIIIEAFVLDEIAEDPNCAGWLRHLYFFAEKIVKSRYEVFNTPEVIVYFRYMSKSNEILSIVRVRLPVEKEEKDATEYYMTDTTNWAAPVQNS